MKKKHIIKLVRLALYFICQIVKSFYNCRADSKILFLYALLTFSIFSTTKNFECLKFLISLFLIFFLVAVMNRRKRVYDFIEALKKSKIIADPDDIRRITFSKKNRQVSIQSSTPLKIFIERKDFLESAWSKKISRIEQNKIDEVIIFLARGSIPKKIELSQKTLDRFFREDPEKVLLGVDVNGDYKFLSFNNNANFLIAGIPGAGKTALFRLWVLLLNLNPKNDIACFFGDLKRVEGANLADHVVFLKTEEEIAIVISFFADELNRRIELFESRDPEKNSENIEMYRTKVGPLTRMILFIDEFISVWAFLLAADKKNKTSHADNLIKICCQGRFAGVNVVIGMQYPEQRYLPSQIKAQSSIISFKLNTIPASINIIGNAACFHLDEHTPGRSFSCSTAGNLLESQAIFVDKMTCQKLLQKIEIKFVYRPFIEWLLEQGEDHLLKKIQEENRYRLNLIKKRRKT